MKALKDLTWDEAEPIFRAFHARKPLIGRRPFEGATGTRTAVWGLLDSQAIYEVPSKPVQKTVVPSAFWELFPDVAQVRYAFGGWAAVDCDLVHIIKMKPIAGFVPGDDPTEIVQRPEIPAPDDGWIDWHGGECPVPWKTPVDVKLRSGNFGYASPAGRYWWDHRPKVPESDIIAYRVVKP